MFDNWLGTVGRVMYKLEALSLGNMLRVVLPARGAHAVCTWYDMILARWWSELKQGLKVP